LGDYLKSAEEGLGRSKVYVDFQKEEKNCAFKEV